MTGCSIRSPGCGWPDIIDGTSATILAGELRFEIGGWAGAGR